MTTSTMSSAKQPLPQLLARRTAIAVAATVLLLVPTVVLFVITRQPSATYAMMGTIVGIFAVMFGGVRIGATTAVVLALLAPLSIVAGLSPVTGAALMALMTLTVGRLSVFGLHRSSMLVPIFLAWPMLTPVPWLPASAVAKVDALLSASGGSLSKAVALAGSKGGGNPAASKAALAEALTRQRFDSHYLGWVALFFFVGAIVPVLLAPLALRKVHLPSPTPHPRSEAVPYTVTITVLTAVATYYFLDHPKLVSGSFFIATVLVLAQVGNDIEWKLTVERVLGTFGGVGLLAVVTSLVGTATYTLVLGVPMPLTLYGFGLLFGVLAIVAKFSPRYWIYFVLITPCAALLNAFTTAQAGSLGEQRLVDNLVGAVLVVVAALVTAAASKFLNPADGVPATSN